jgi:hypothetical protein
LGEVYQISNAGVYQFTSAGDNYDELRTIDGIKSRYSPH